MRKALPGHAMSLQDPALGAMDGLLDPAIMGSRMARGLLKHQAIQVVAAVPQSVRWKPGVGLNVSWLCALSDGSTERITARSFSKRERLDTATAKTLTHTLVDSTHCRALAVDESINTLFLLFPNDRDLPGLPRILDTGRGKHVIASAVDWIRERSLRVRARSSRLEVLRYKPERRCVLRLDLSLADDRTGDRTRTRLFARVLTRELAASAIQTLSLLDGRDLPIVSYLGGSTETATIFQGEAVGALLDELPGNSRASAAAGNALAKLNGAGNLPGVPQSSFLSRLDALAADVEAFAGLGTREMPWAVARDVVDRLRDGVATESESVLVHGDFHPGQCVVEGSSVRLFDLDSVGVDSPARDAGFFLASLHAREISGQITPSEHAGMRSGFLLGFGNENLPGLARETALGLAIHGLSPVRRLEQNCLERAAAMFQRAQEMLPAVSRRRPEQFLRDLLSNDRAARAAAASRILSEREPVLKADVVRMSPREGARAELELAVVRTAHGAVQSRHRIYEDGRFRSPREDRMIAQKDLLAAVAAAHGLETARMEHYEVVELTLRPERRSTHRVDVVWKNGTYTRDVVRWTTSKIALQKAAAMVTGVVTGTSSHLVRPLYVHAESGCSVYPYVDSETLAEQLHRGAPLEPEVVADVLREFHGTPAPAGLTEIDHQTEFANLSRLRHRLLALRCGEPGGLDRSVEQLETVRTCVARSSPHLIHGDLYDQQILMDRSGDAHVIDFDTLGVGDPRLDLGNFIAHLTLAVHDGANVAVCGTLTGMLKNQAGGDSATLRWYTALSLVRIAMVHYPRSCGTRNGRELALRLLREADELLRSL